MKDKTVITILLIVSVLTISMLMYFKSRNDIITQKNIMIDDEEVEKVGECNNPIVPNGFKKVETQSASWQLENGIPKDWNKGLVIEDEVGNQFVWVPIKSMDDYKLLNFINYKISSEVNSELNKLRKYSGFYVSRYEAGVPEELQNTLTDISEKTNNIKGVPVSKKGIKPWNFISVENAKASAELMYSNEYIYSELLTIREWMQINAWVSENGYKVDDAKDYGNFSNVNFKFNGLYSDDIGKTYVYGEDKNKAVKNMILCTGATDRNLTNNIYDIYGNVAEISESKYYSFNEDHVERVGLMYEAVGGYYDNSSKGEYFTPAWPNSKIGFRVVLYIK